MKVTCAICMTLIRKRKEPFYHNYSGPMEVFNRDHAELQECRRDAERQTILGQTLQAVS